MQDRLKDRLESLVRNLQTLENNLAGKPAAAPKPPKVKDPIKQLMAQFLASLTPDERAAFQILSDDEKRARLAQIFEQPKTAQPGTPSSVTSPASEPTEPIEPTEPSDIPAPPTPSAAPIAPPPAPGLPPAFIGTKPKPVAAPVLPVLTPEQLAQKTDDEKNRSDAVFLEMLKDLATTEYLNSNRFKEIVGKALKDLRNKEQFLKRAELDALMQEKTGLFALLQKDFSVDKANANARLQELYETFTGMILRPDALFKTIITPLAACLFAPQRLSVRDIELLVVSSIVAQRQAPAVKGSENVTEAAQQSSDAAFLAVWDQFTKDKAATLAPENALNALARSLNFLRIQPAFILFGDMLWKGLEGTTQRGVQKGKKISPLLVFLFNPREFVTQPATGAVEIKRNAARHIFDLTLFENEIHNDSLKSALTWQLANTKPVITMSLPDFVRDRLQKVASLTQLQTLLKSVTNVYQGQLGERESSVLQGLQTELAKSSLDAAKIVSGLTELAPNMPQDLLNRLRDLVESDAQDKQVIAIVVDARKVPTQFKERILVASESMPVLHDQLVQVLGSLYRTPRDVYLAINRAVKNKKSLIDNGITVESMYELIKPYGILLRIFDYFAARYQLIKEDPDKVKQNLAMLIESLNAVTSPMKYYSPKGSAAKTVSALKATAASSSEAGRALLDLSLAPVLLDVETNEQLLGVAKAGYYSEQLSATRRGSSSMGIYESLAPLTNLINERNAAGVINYLTDFVRKAQGIDVQSAPFIELMQRVQAALEGSFAQPQ